MVRRVELTRIDDELSRQLSFAKRRNGLIKKALELFVVCDVDCVFISFSPSGRLSYFFGDKRAEQVLARFAAIPEHIRRFHLSEQENQEFIGILNELKERTDEQLRNDRTVVALQREISRVNAELESVTSEISKKYEPSLDSIMTIEEANICEATIEETLARVQQRMRELSENNENDATQASGYRIEAREAPQAEPADQPAENSNRNNHQMLIHQSPAHNSQLTFRERTPSRNPFSEMVRPYPQQGMSFSNLLMSADVPETLSPLPEIVPHAPSLPLLLSSQPLDQNSRNTFHQNQYNLLQDGFPNTHQVYQNGHIPEVMQSLGLNGSTYGTPNGYFFPHTNLPSQQYQLPANPFQAQASNTIPVPPMQSPFYQFSPHMHLGENSNMAPFNGPQWPNQRALQQNPSLFGQNGGYQEMLTSVSEMNNIYAQDAASSAAYFRPPNLQMNHQSMGGHSVRPSLALNLQGSLSNAIPQGLLGNQMHGIQGHLEAVGSPASSNKRKLPWVNQDGTALRITNNQNMHPEPSRRTRKNAVYSNAYDMMGLPVDPHLRILEEISNRDESSDSITSITNNQLSENQPPSI